MTANAVSDENSPLRENTSPSIASPMAVLWRVLPLATTVTRYGTAHCQRHPGPRLDPAR